MKVSSFFTAAFAALAAASPVGEKRFSSSQLATFDDLPSVPAVSQLNPVGVYKGLNYKSLNVLEAGVGGVLLTGVKPQSGKNTAANAINDSILRGAPAFVVDKAFKSFDLDSLFFGCVLNTAVSVTGVPQQCTVAFTVYKKGSKTPFQTLNKQFNPDNAVLSKMTKATFPKSWAGAERVDIAIVQATGTSTLSALLIDNVSYKLNK